MPSLIDDRLSPNAGARHDLVARIERVVHSRTAGRIRELRVDVDDDSVVLSGVVPTYYTKQLATHAAMDELSHHRLVNSIDVG